MQVQIEALRRAASALLEAATDQATLRTVLRALIDERPDIQPRSNGGAANNAADRQHSAKKPQQAAANKPSATTDAAWAELRQRLKQAKAVRGISNAELAAAIGASVKTVRNTVSTNRSPTKAMRAKLESWLAEPVSVPEVAATATTFRHNGHASAGRSAD
jgi:ribosome-binding protein aMBF1 (putative translation factor)